MKRTIDDAKWFCPTMAKKYCSIRLALCVVVCYSFFAFFSARETLRRHKTKIEIEASLAEDEHFVFHKAKLLVGSTKPGKFKHFTDGAPVYVASKRQNGILLGSPFDCPVLLKRERKGNVLLAIVTSLIFIGGQKKGICREGEKHAIQSTTPSTTLFQDRSTCH